MESHGSDDVFDVRSRPIRAAVECDVVRRVSERNQEHSGRYRLRFVHQRNVLLESCWGDDLLVVLSRHLRQRVERHRLSRVRTRSVRVLGSILHMRALRPGLLRRLERVDRVHRVRSRHVRGSQRHVRLYAVRTGDLCGHDWTNRLSRRPPRLRRGGRHSPVSRQHVRADGGGDVHDVSVG